MKYHDEKVFGSEANWVEKEMNEIISERHNAKKKKSKTSPICAFFLILFTATVCAINCIEADPIGSTSYSNNGVSWRCSGCGKHCWSNARDWKGDYYCNSCGTRK